jgi:DNA-binding LacI/PurR family transcriptional regulator
MANRNRPLAASAQQGERIRRVAVLTPLPGDHPDAKARHQAFLEALRQSGESGHSVDRAEQDFCPWRRDTEKCC